eukprot:4580714-Ditylum_brightwellii.AAC.1
MDQSKFLVVTNGSAGEIDMSFGWKYVLCMGILLLNMLVQDLEKLHPSVLKAMGCYQHLAFSVVQ